MLELRIEVDGAEHAVACRSGLSVMEVIRSAGLPLEAACGGSLACATCHVIVADGDFSKVGQPSEDEEDMLDQAFGVTRTSRLGCQIMMTPDLDGLRVRIPIRAGS